MNTKRKRCRHAFDRLATHWRLIHSQMTNLTCSRIPKSRDLLEGVGIFGQIYRFHPLPSSILKRAHFRYENIIFCSFRQIRPAWISGTSCSHKGSQYSAKFQVYQVHFILFQRFLTNIRKTKNPLANELAWGPKVWWLISIKLSTQRTKGIFINFTTVKILWSLLIP